MRKLAILPNLVTLGNGICGFIAILYIGLYAMETADPTVSEDQAFHKLVIAAWLILLGLLFDGIDGKIARMTRSASDFGAQLDSLCDAVSFGVAPALMVATMTTGKGDPYWEKVVWFFAVAYVSCALMRLARYNVEQAKPEEEYHLDFKGLPSPAAAGVVVTLIILMGYLTHTEAVARDLRHVLGAGLCTGLSQAIKQMLPIVVACLAYLMISTRIRYPHLLNTFFKGKHNYDYFAYIVFAGIFLVLLREAVLVVAFGGYALLGILSFLAREAFGWTPKVLSAFAPPHHANEVLLGVGSNRGQRRMNIKLAIDLLTLNEDITVVKRSKYIKTKAVGGPHRQRKYLNGAMLIKTSLKPAELLIQLQDIEDELGRERDEHWGPRTIDLDILLYEDFIIQDDELTIPHPLMHKRDFVLKPANEIAPDMMHPTLEATVAELFVRFDQTSSETA